MSLSDRMNPSSHPPVVAGSLPILCLALLLGCGGSASPEPEPAGTAKAAQPPAVPPLASLGNRPDENQVVRTSQSGRNATDEAEDLDLGDEPAPLPEPERGSPEWSLREITRLRTAPADVVREPVRGEPGRFEQVRLPPEQAARERVRRLYKIIELATEVIGKTHAEENREQLFNNAVHYLADARMQLALEGDDEQGDLLQEDAEALFLRDSTSFAAVEAAFKVVQLVQTQAQRQAQEDSKWAIAFARQTRLFAEKFPQESSRAGVQLLAAGRMCDNLGLSDQAKSCLLVLEERFPESPFSEQASGTLRRLRLPGEPLVDFGGSTHDGGYASIEQFRGKTVLIAFWASNSANFRGDLPAIRQTLEKYGEKVAAVGVNLDRDELAIDRFLEATGLDWKHIFYSDPGKRGAKNLIARHYGVINVPTYWLVDPQGTVKNIYVDVRRLDQQIAETLR